VKVELYKEIEDIVCDDLCMLDVSFCDTCTKIEKLIVLFDKRMIVCCYADCMFVDDKCNCPRDDITVLKKGRCASYKCKEVEGE
jgi:hypothetical protein